MLTTVNSDLPGQILGQIRENVYDLTPASTC
jgi:type IV secretory pathway VirB10-like protein